MPEIRDLMRPSPVVVPSDTPLVLCARRLLDHPSWRMLVVVDDGRVEGLVDDIAVFGNGVLLEEGLWFAFEPDGPDQAGTVARPAPTVESSDPAGTALRALQGQPGVVVVEDGAVVGLLTEHDLMGKASTVLLGSRTVDETGSRPVISVPSDTTARAALQRMGDARIRHLAVVDDELVGVVSLRDVVAGWVSPEMPVRRVVSRDPHSVLLGTSQASAATTMAERDIGCLPVLDGDRALVAILTRSDIVDALAASSDDEDLFA